MICLEDKSLDEILAYVAQEVGPHSYVQTVELVQNNGTQIYQQSSRSYHIVFRGKVSHLTLVVRVSDSVYYALIYYVGLEVPARNEVDHLRFDTDLISLTCMERNTYTFSCRPYVLHPYDLVTIKDPTSGQTSKIYVSNLKVGDIVSNIGTISEMINIPDTKTNESPCDDRAEESEPATDIVDDGPVDPKSDSLEELLKQVATTTTNGTNKHSIEIAVATDRGISFDIHSDDGLTDNYSYSESANISNSENYENYNMLFDNLKNGLKNIITGCREE